MQNDRGTQVCSIILALSATVDKLSRNLEVLKFLAKAPAASTKNCKMKFHHGGSSFLCLYMCWKDDKMLPIVVALAKYWPTLVRCQKFLAQIILVRIGAELGQTKSL